MKRENPMLLKQINIQNNTQFQVTQYTLKSIKTGVIQVVGGTLIVEDGLVVMAGVE